MMKLFHARAAATRNARSPRLDRLVTGTDKVDVEPDLRRLQDKVMSMLLLSSSFLLGSLPMVNSNKLRLCNIISFIYRDVSCMYQVRKKSRFF